MMAERSEHDLMKVTTNSNKVLQRGCLRGGVLCLAKIESALAAHNADTHRVNLEIKRRPEDLFESPAKRNRAR